MSDWISAYKTVGAVGFLLIFMVVALIYIGKYFKQIFESTLKKSDDLQNELLKQGAEKERFYKKQLDMQKQESEANIAEVKKELKEERLSSERERKRFIEQLEVINQNTAKTATILEKLEVTFNNKFNSLNKEVMNIKENLN